MRLQLQQLAEKVLGVSTGQTSKVLNPEWGQQSGSRGRVDAGASYGQEWRCVSATGKDGLLAKPC